MTYYTYLHCEPNGDPFYVGKGTRKRSHHLRYRRNRDHQKIVDEHGDDNILVYVFECDSESQAIADEKQQIRQLFSDGYKLSNMVHGGCGMSRRKLSPEHRSKIAAANLGKIMSKEARLNMSLAAKGKTAWNKGKPWPEETRIKFIGNKSAIGCIRSEETRKKMSLSKKGRGKPWSDKRWILFKMKH